MPLIDISSKAEVVPGCSTTGKYTYLIDSMTFFDKGLKDKAKEKENGLLKTNILIKNRWLLKEKITPPIKKGP